MVINFNMPPQFSAAEITLPLPADDEAWEAPAGETCALALGLHGEHSQARHNTIGSFRLKSLEFHHATQALYNGSVNVLPQMTNIFSEFVLIHALHVDSWKLQQGRFDPSPQNPPAETLSKLLIQP